MRQKHLLAVAATLPMQLNIVTDNDDDDAVASNCMRLTIARKFFSGILEAHQYLLI